MWGAMCAGGFALASAAALAAAAGVERKTESFAKNSSGFHAFSERIISQNPRNLLARQPVRVRAKGVSQARALSDGDAGEYAGAGRVNISGKPTIITYYLGQAKPIHRVGLFSCNGDTRANQDWEVCLVDNSARRGKMPKFPDKPTFTTGEKILGTDGGGFYTYFARADGGPVVPHKADWVQFRIWRTYPVRAGQPAHNANAESWSAVIELEVLGDPKDAKVIPPEEKQRRERLRQILREAPKQPEYEKRATWQETMVAAREAILRWECHLDALAAEAAGVSIGGWHTLGALPAGDPAIRELAGVREIDLAKGLTLKGKGKGAASRTLRWRPCEKVADGRTADLAALLGAKTGQVVVLCRTLEIRAGFSKRSGFAFGVGSTGGSMRLVGGSSRTSIPAGGRPAVPNGLVWGLRDGPGRYHVLAQLPVTEEAGCRLWLMPQTPTSRPGAGDTRARGSRRRGLFGRLSADFSDPVSQAQMRWERADNIWSPVVKGRMARRDYRTTDWPAGEQPGFLVEQYNLHAVRRGEALLADLAAVPASRRARIEAWARSLVASKPPGTVADARRRYYAVATLRDALAEAHRVESLRLAVEDQQRTFGPKYPRAKGFLTRVAALDRGIDEAFAAALAGDEGALGKLASLHQRVAADSAGILLANPLLTSMGKLLLGRGGPRFSSNWGGANNVGGELVTLSPVRLDGEFTTVYKGGRISDMDLSWDAGKILFSDGRHIHEVGADGTGHRQITNQRDEHVMHYDACRLPSGKIVFVSTACEQAVPCTGGWHVGNLHVIDDDGTNERRLTYDQDHNWNPFVLNNGQVVFTRWEYADTPHYFTRLLFTMNPDGTAQMEYYGSNSYWPNAMYWARPIPGHPTRVVCIVSGHHGVSRVGQMVILDNAQGRHEADGVVQRIGERGKKVEPLIIDGLVKDWWPRYAYPWPLAEGGTNKGAGKYFLVNGQMDEWSSWGVYLVDVFDNVTQLLPTGYACPIPLVPRPKPPVIPDRVDPRRDDALVYMADVYTGQGLAGYPRGCVKALRIGSHVYRYGGNGDTRAATYEGGWDVKRILGTVPVEPDGSAYFRVPCNTPVFVQPLDKNGQALQTMRSWFTAMPGEVISCVGCHERQSTTPTTRAGVAPTKVPAEIAPWFGPTRGFSYERELQPVLDRRCVGCHDGKQSGRPDFRAKRIRKDATGNYSPAYLALAPYVRRAGYEADYHMPRPSEWSPNTSPLVQMFLKGHHNVQLTRDEWRRLYTWIDFNVPYAGNWRESHRPPEDDQVNRRVKYMKLYANIDCDEEDPLPPSPVVAFERPAPEPAPPAPARLAGWPWTPADAVKRQQGAGLGTLTVDLGDGVSMSFAPVPGGSFVMGDANGAPDERRESVVAVKRPFHIGRLEVTNRQYARFDAVHDSAYMDARGKDRFTRGYPVNEPNQPVVRVSWHRAMAFCRWLSRKTGRECTLPTEAEWEYACRAGSATPWSFGPAAEKLPPVANTADATLSGWGWGRVDRRYRDGERFSVQGGKYPPNAWGLRDMHGNVAEWTLSDYRPYPYAASDGRNELPSLTDPDVTPKVIRGGSWNDKLRQCRSASRWGYPPHQPVYNVGFRVVIRPGKLARRAGR